MQVWVLLGVLVLGELFVLVRLPSAVVNGRVPLNPLGWFGYGELSEESVDRDSAPGAYWLIVALLATTAVLLGCFIYVVIVRGVG
jgi:hypothetical protein